MICFLAAGVFSLAMLGAAEAEYDMGEVKSQVSAIMDEKLHRLEGSALDEQALLGSREFRSLREICTKDWKNIVEELDAVGSDAGRTLVIWAMGDLGAEDYMSLLETLSVKHGAGTIGDGLMRDALFPRGRMAAFSTDNHDHPRMKAVLGRIRSKAADDAMGARISGVLGGGAKKALDGYREGHQGLAEGDIPVILLKKD